MAFTGTNTTKLRTIELQNIVNAETRDKIRGLDDNSPELLTTFLNDIPNGKSTAVIANLNLNILIKSL